MLAKEFRLTGKDINFLVKKRQYIVADYFSFCYFKQYKNIGYHQISFNIPLKLSKKAVFRHIIKRAIVAYVQNDDLTHIPLKESFYKVFVMVNKSSLPGFQKAIEKLDKKAIISFVQKEFKKSWKVFSEKIC